MPVEFVLVRHGESEGNRDRYFTGHGPTPLTALGVRQAEATARALAQRPVECIYSSDLVRCVQTAAPLVSATGKAPVETSRLRERDMGDFTGLTFAQVEERFPDAWGRLLSRDAHGKPPGGESHFECVSRVGAILEEIVARHATGDEGEKASGSRPTQEVRQVVIYSHGVAINHMLRHLLGIDRAAAPLAFFHVDNCSMQRFVRRAESQTTRILAVNEVTHLLEVGRST